MTIRESDVIAFLRDNPTVLNQHPQLLADLDITHPSGGAVSLIERQVSVLREQKNTLEVRLHALIEAARENDAAQQRLLDLLLEFAEPSDLADLLTRVQQHLQHDFAIDTVQFLFTAATAAEVRHINVEDAAFKPFKGILNGTSAACGRLEKSQLDALFDNTAGNICSAAVVPLGKDQPIGLLAMGSHSEERFSPVGGTELLSRMGRLLGAFIAARL